MDMARSLGHVDGGQEEALEACLLYTSDAADE